jgi:hypothetical protein
MRLTFLTAALLALTITAASAQLVLPGASTQRPDLTSDFAVAMVYYRLTGKPPDFAAWARLSDAYRDAADYEKTAVLEKKTEEFQQNFSLLSTDDLVIVTFKAQLSEYNLKNEGYLIENFTPDMYFPFSYANENFAVVPRGAFDNQWLPVKDMPAKQIDDLRRAAADGKTVTITLSLMPRSADKGKPVTLDGKPFRLVAADLRAISFYDAAGALVFKESLEKPAAAATPEQQRLMNLYR